MTLSSEEIDAIICRTNRTTFRDYRKIVKRKWTFVFSFTSK